MCPPKKRVFQKFLKGAPIKLLEKAKKGVFKKRTQPISPPLSSHILPSESEILVPNPSHHPWSQ